MTQYKIHTTRYKKHITRRKKHTIKHKKHKTKYKIYNLNYKTQNKTNKINKISIINGGAYIGKGSNGCVFRPSITGTILETETILESSISNISKIINKGNIKNEYNTDIINILINCDPGYKYLVYPIAITSIDQTEFDKNKIYFENCNTDGVEQHNVQNPYDKHDNSFQIETSNLEAFNNAHVNIIQPYGGDIVKANIKLYDLLNVFKGVLLFNTYGLCHKDLKIDNLVDTITGLNFFGYFVSHNIRIIDFSTMCKITDFTIAQIFIGDSNFYYNWMPFEYNWFINNNYNDVVAEPKKNIPFTQYIDSLDDSLFRICDKTDWLLTVIYEINIMKNSIKDTEVTNQVATTFDVYSLGIILSIWLVNNNIINIKPQIIKFIKSLTKVIRPTIYEATTQFLAILLDYKHNILQKIYTTWS